MKCIMKKHKAKGLTLSEAAIPKISKNEVLIKIKAASICGSDYHIYKWDGWSEERVKVPVIIGHEFAGEVVEVGADVKRIKIGDYVSAESHIPCGYCKHCRIGYMHVCENLKIIGVDRDGCFAEYIALPEINIWVNGKDLPLELASIQEPFGNAVDTVLAEDVHTKSVAVLGCGPIGLMAIAIAKASGASMVIATEIMPYRINLAKKMGADIVLNPKECNVVEEVLKLTNGEGVDVSLEMSGAQESLDLAFKILTFGGRVSLLGIPSKPITLDINNYIIFKGARVYGIIGRKMFSTWYKISAFLEKKLVNLLPLITHKFPLENYETAMELIAKGESGKIILYP